MIYNIISITYVRGMETTQGQSSVLFRDKAQQDLNKIMKLLLAEKPEYTTLINLNFSSQADKLIRLFCDVFADIIVDENPKSSEKALNSKKLKIMGCFIYPLLFSILSENKHFEQTQEIEGLIKIFSNPSTFKDMFDLFSKLYSIEHLANIGVAINNLNNFFKKQGLSEEFTAKFKNLFLLNEITKKGKNTYQFLQLFDRSNSNKQKLIDLQQNAFVLLDRLIFDKSLSQDKSERTRQVKKIVMYMCFGSFFPPTSLWCTITGTLKQQTVTNIENYEIDVNDSLLMTAFLNVVTTQQPQCVLRPANDIPSGVLFEKTVENLQTNDPQNKDLIEQIATDIWPLLGQIEDDPKLNNMIEDITITDATSFIEQVTKTALALQAKQKQVYPSNRFRQIYQATMFPGALQVEQDYLNTAVMMCLYKVVTTYISGFVLLEKHRHYGIFTHDIFDLLKIQRPKVFSVFVIGDILKSTEYAGIPTKDPYGAVTMQDWENFAKTNLLTQEQMRNAMINLPHVNQSLRQKELLSILCSEQIAKWPVLTKIFNSDYQSQLLLKYYITLINADLPEFPTPMFLQENVSSQTVTLSNDYTLEQMIYLYKVNNPNNPQYEEYIAVNPSQTKGWKIVPARLGSMVDFKIIEHLDIKNIQKYTPSMTVVSDLVFSEGKSSVPVTRNYSFQHILNQCEQYVLNAPYPQTLVTSQIQEKVEEVVAKQDEEKVEKPLQASDKK